MSQIVTRKKPLIWSLLRFKSPENTISDCTFWNLQSTFPMQSKWYIMSWKVRLEWKKKHTCNLALVDKTKWQLINCNFWQADTNTNFSFYFIFFYGLGLSREIFKHLTWWWIWLLLRLNLRWLDGDGAQKPQNWIAIIQCLIVWIPSHPQYCF